MKNKNNLHKLPTNFCYIYGKHPALAAITNPARTIEKIFCTQDIFHANQKIISVHAYEIVQAEFLTKLLGASGSHQGIIVRAKTIFSDDMNCLDLQSPNCRIVILDQITDPQNIGSIIRSAAAFGIQAIIMPTDNSPDESGSIAKAASGTLEIVKVIKVTNLKSTIESLKKQGFWVIGLDGESDELLSNKLFSGKIVIALGAEDKGLRRLTKEACDHVVKIPMSEKVESLNVANAAAIVFHMASMDG